MCEHDWMLSGPAWPFVVPEERLDPEELEGILWHRRSCHKESVEKDDNKVSNGGGNIIVFDYHYPNGSEQKLDGTVMFLACHRSNDVTGGSNDVSFDAGVDVDAEEQDQPAICYWKLCDLASDECQATVKNLKPWVENVASKKTEQNEEHKNHELDNALTEIASNKTTTFRIDAVSTENSALKLLFLNYSPMLLGYAWLVLSIWALWCKLRSTKMKDFNAKMEPMTATPSASSRCRRQGTFLTPPSPFKNGATEPMELMSPCYGEDGLNVSQYENLRSDELRMLLRERRIDATGNKSKLIRKLITSYQSEFACLTVRQLRPKLRRLKLPQNGGKAEIIRRLVEAGPP